MSETALNEDVDEAALDKETLLDITVNLIPMGIILFFIILFLAFNPWPNLHVDFVSHALLVIPFVSLGLLTYLASKYI